MADRPLAQQSPFAAAARRLRPSHTDPAWTNRSQLLRRRLLHPETFSTLLLILHWSVRLGRGATVAEERRTSPTGGDGSVASLPIMGAQRYLNVLGIATLSVHSVHRNQMPITLGAVARAPPPGLSSTSIGTIPEHNSLSPSLSTSYGTYVQHTAILFHTARASSSTAAITLDTTRHPRTRNGTARPKHTVNSICYRAFLNTGHGSSPATSLLQPSTREPRQHPVSRRAAHLTHTTAASYIVVHERRLVPKPNLSRVKHNESGIQVTHELRSWLIRGTASP